MIDSGWRGSSEVETNLEAMYHDSGLHCREWSDDALMAAVARHHTDAYAELYRRHWASVAATVRTVLGNGAECDDVVADVFVGIWMSPTFDTARGSLLGFLRLRAKCHSIDVVRAETSRKRREQGGLSAERDPGEDVDSAFLAVETAAALRRAVGLLPAAERQAIQLAFYDGMSYRAVALHLNLPQGTVKSRIRRGLQRLRHTSDVWGFVEDGIGPPDPSSSDRVGRPARPSAR